MASMLNKSFIRGVIKRVHDCSNPIQLGTYLKRYQNYVFTPEIQAVFLRRIDFFKERFVADNLMLERCEDLLETLETEIQIANVCSKNRLPECDNSTTNRKITSAHQENLNIDYLQYSDDYPCEHELDLLRQVFDMTNGNKVVICRILDIDNNFLNKKVNQYKLKTYLNEIRRDFRAKSKHKVEK